MTIDVGALRKFQSTWGPVLDAIPAVITMAEKQADFERALTAQAVALKKAQDEVVKVYAEADVKLTEINEQLAKVADERRDVIADIAALKEAAKAAAQDAETALIHRLNATNELIAARQDELTNLDVKLMAAQADAAAAHEADVKARTAEITALEKRQAAAEKALETLRTKLG